MNERLRWLFRRQAPLYGQVTLYVLLGCAVAFAGYFLTHWPPPHPTEARTGPASILAVLPDGILLSWWSAAVCGFGLILGGLGWVFRRELPWSSWLAALSFTALVALYMENAEQATHVAHLTNWVLLVYALWYHFEAKQIKQADAAGAFWKTALYPRWAHTLSVICVGTLYTYSGLTKLYWSGTEWANGLSLQLWASLWGDPRSPWTQWILEHRLLAQTMQWLTLVAETTALLGVMIPLLRPGIGLLLIGFHLGSICVFGWGFHANAVIIALTFLPFDVWLSRNRFFPGPDKRSTQVWR